MFDNFKSVDLINVILYYNIYQIYYVCILVYMLYHNAVYIIEVRRDSKLIGILVLISI